MDYATLTLSELRSYAKAKGIKGISTLRKDKLIEKINEFEETQKASEQSQKAPKPDKKTSEPARKTSEPARKNSEPAQKTQQEQKPHQMREELEELDSGNKAYGILEVMPDGFGFIRCENYLPG